jgi:CMP-N-acetylneuraminic acid synthetase
VKTLAIIPARAGSRGVPRKNIRELLDKPVVAYTMEAALAAMSVDRIVVTTDDSYVKEIAREYDIPVIDRPEYLASDSAKIDDVMRHCCVELSKTQNDVPNNVVLLYANIPVRADDIIDRVVDKLVETGADSVQSMAPVGKFHPYWLYKVDDDRASVYIKNNVYRRQNLPPVYTIDGAAAAVTLTSLMESAEEPDPHAFWGDDRRAVLQESHETVDIDSLRDFYLAEAILREKAEEALNLLK